MKHLTSNPCLIGLAAATALAASGCASTGYSAGPGGYGTAPSSYGTTASCADCGVITDIQQIRTSTAPSATGAVLGGIVGAVAGRELADDESEGRRNTATVAGAAAGAAAGNAIQSANETRYNVRVRLDDGRSTTMTVDSMGGLQVGSPVRISNGRLLAR